MSQGRPPIFQTPEAFEAKVNEYFISLKLTKDPPTITGLCLFAGFDSRQSFYDYAERDGFSYTVKKARLRIEHEYEKALLSKFPTGPIFALKNMGWKDKTEVENIGAQKIEVVWDKSLLPPTSTD